MSTDEPLIDDTDEQDDSSDDHVLAVADPQQYNQNQRLKEIHQARREAQQAFRDAGRYSTQSEKTERNADVAYAVASYGHELRPLIRQADMEVPKLPDGFDIDDLDEYLKYGGLIKKLGDNKITAPEAHRSMLVFGILNDALAELGLDAKLDAGLDDDMI